jgi:hypothetical protein
LLIGAIGRTKFFFSIKTRARLANRLRSHFPSREPFSIVLRPSRRFHGVERGKSYEILRKVFHHVRRGREKKVKEKIKQTTSVRTNKRMRKQAHFNLPAKPITRAT